MEEKTKTIGASALTCIITVLLVLGGVSLTDDDVYYCEARGANLTANDTIEVANAWKLNSTQIGSDDTARGGILNEAPSKTNPNFCPAITDADTGIGRQGVDNLSIIGGGDEVARASEAASYEQFIISPDGVQNAVATPSLAFGDADTGLYESNDDVLEYANAGNLILSLLSTGIKLNQVSAAYIVMEQPTATNPVYTFVDDTDVGGNLIQVNGVVENNASLTNIGGLTNNGSFTNIEEGSVA